MTTEIKYHTKEEAMYAVTCNGFNLGFCASEFKSDEAMVMAALKQHARAFEYTSAELKSNKVFIMEALNEGINPEGLIENASDLIQSDIEVMTLALEKSDKGLVFSLAKGELFLNKELAAKALVKWNPKSKHRLAYLYLWGKFPPSLQEFFPEDSLYEKAKSHLIQLEQEKQAELVSGGSTGEDGVVW